MVNLDWDLRGYLSHRGNHRVVHYIPETAQGVMTDALSISFLFLLKRDSGSQSQTKSQGGWMAQWCRLQTACSRWGTVRLPQCLILWQDMAAMPTLFFSSDYLWANMYNFPTFWIQPSLWTSLSFFVLPNTAWLKNEELGYESDKATLGFRARGGIFGIRRGYGSSPESFGRGNVFLNPISQDTLDINLWFVMYHQYRCVDKKIWQDKFGCLCTKKEWKTVSESRGLDRDLEGANTL